MEPITLNLDTLIDKYEQIDLSQGLEYDLEIFMTEKRKKVDLSKCTIQIQVQKANHNFVIQTEKITVTDNKMLVQLDKDVTRENGKGKLQVVLTTIADGRTFGSWVVKLRIKESALNDSDGQSENKVTITEALTVKIAEAVIAKDALDKSIAAGDVDALRADVTQLKTEVNTNTTDIARLTSNVDKLKLFYGKGEAITSHLLKNAYIYFGGTSTPHGLFSVAIRDSALNAYYFGYHNFSETTFHDATRVAGTMTVNTNTNGTIVPNEGNINDQEFTIVLISGL